jgi:hypothetical protein
MEIFLAVLLVLHDIFQTPILLAEKMGGQVREILDLRRLLELRQLHNVPECFLDSRKYVANSDGILLILLLPNIPK